MTYAIIVETDDAVHRDVAQVERREQGVLVAEALYAHGLHIRYAWLVEQSESGRPRLLDAWPQHHSDPSGCQASIAAWKAAPCGAGGATAVNRLVSTVAPEPEPEPEPREERDINTEMAVLLAYLPAHYAPVRFGQTEQRGYFLEIKYTIIFQNANAEEALNRTARYMAERERNPLGWDLPIGVIDGIYD